MSYLGDLDIDYDKDGEIEIEIENDDPERAQIRERGQDLLQDLEPSRLRDLFGR